MPVAQHVGCQSSFQSTPSSRRETRAFCFRFHIGQWISIHSLLAEGDRAEEHDGQKRIISIHSLLAEGDIFA